MLLKSIEVPKRFREEKTMGNLNLPKNIPESTLQIFTLVVQSIPFPLYFD